MKANLTRSPWRRRPSLFLGFRAPSAAADSHAVTAPVLPVRRSSTLRLDLAQHRSRPAVPSAARRSRPAPVPAQSRRYSCHYRPPAAPPRPCTQPKTSAACPARVSPSATPNCTFVLLGVSTQPGQVHLADLDAELEQFTVDPGRSPERVGGVHLPNQIPNFAFY